MDADTNTQANCGKCIKPVNDEDAVGCEGGCQIWFHKECTGITKGEFDILRRNTCNLMWMCTSCRSQLQRQKTKPNEDELSMLRKDMEESNSQLKNQLETLEESIMKKVEA